MSGYSFEQLTDLFTAWEAEFPVDRWQVNGVRFWPLVRINLVLDLIYSGTSDHAPDPLRGGVGRGVAFGRDLLAHLRAGWGDRAANQSLRHPYRAVFLTASQARVGLGDGWYDRFCGPLVDDLAERGDSALVLERVLGGDFRLPRRGGSKFVTPRLQWLRLKGKLAGRGLGSSVRLDGYDRFLDRLRDLGLKSGLPELDRLAVFTAAIDRLTDYFKSVLIRTRAQVGFVVAWYGFDGMAFCRACRQLGLPAVDIQHGVQSEMNSFYGHWTKIPAGGFDLMPEVFWCWSEAEAQVIRAWAGPDGLAHRPFVGGNPWLEMWGWGRGEDAAGLESRLTAAMAATQARRQVLIALQPHVEMISPWVMDALAGAGDEVYWWPRLHPVWLSHKADQRAKFSAAVGDRFNLDLATDLPLGLLLKQVDCVITDASATAVEAASMGVPAIITGASGPDLYRDHIAAGRMAPAANGDELRRLIQDAPDWRARVFSKRDLPRPLKPNWLDELLAGRQTGLTPAAENRS